MTKRQRDPEERKRANAKYRERHRDKLAERARDYQKRNPHIYREAAKKHYWKHRTRLFARKYNVDVSVIEALPDHCEICGAVEKLCVDHCHTTGQVRGTLCDGCNRGLGYFRERPEVLVNAANYLNTKLVADRLAPGAA